MEGYGNVDLNQHTLDDLIWRMGQPGDALTGIMAWLWSHANASSRVRDEMLKSFGFERRPTPMGGTEIVKI